MSGSERCGAVSAERLLQWGVQVLDIFAELAGQASAEIGLDINTVWGRGVALALHR